MKVWNGTEYVDPSYKVWNGTAYVDPREMHIWSGTEFVKVWPSFIRQRMVKTNQTQLKIAWEVLPNWASDATYPAIVSGNSMQVVGRGNVNAVLSWNFYDWGGRPSQVRLMQNGVDVYTSAVRSGSATYVETFPLSVENGDLLTVEAQYTTSYGTVYIRGTGDTFLELIP